MLNTGEWDFLISCLPRSPWFNSQKCWWRLIISKQSYKWSLLTVTRVAWTVPYRIHRISYDRNVNCKSSEPSKVNQAGRWTWVWQLIHIPFPMLYALPTLLTDLLHFRLHNLPNFWPDLTHLPELSTWPTYLTFLQFILLTRTVSQFLQCFDGPARNEWREREVGLWSLTTLFTLIWARRPAAQIDIINI